MSDKKSTIPTEEELSEVKIFWMIHRSHTSKIKYASVQCFENETECSQEIMRLSLKNPNKRYYKLKSEMSMINKVKDAVLEAVEIK
jgi:hypothetical protein